MPFNSDTYYANKFRTDAFAALERAKDIKARAKRGEAKPWEPGEIPGLIRIARHFMHMSIGRRQLVAMAREIRKR